MAGPREQPLPPDVIGREDATEVLRAFVIDGGLSIAFQRAFEEPDMWGLLLVDIARHAARAYARESDYTEGDPLKRTAGRSKPRSRARPTRAPPRLDRNKVTDDANQHSDARAVADHGKGQPCQMAQEGGRQ